MKEYLLLILAFAVILFIIYLLVKFSETFRKKAYELFLYAEHNFITEARMNYVVMEIYTILPFPLTLLPMDFYEDILQKMFDEIKDLLDDGKSNKSTKVTKK